MKMETRNVWGKNISLLGFGCMRFPCIEGTQEIDLQQTEKMIDYAYSHGVNYFDTAYPYHEGKSETAIGQLLKKYPRDSFFLADKMPGWQVKSIEDVDRIFHDQLKKCGVEYFDFYLCHSLSQDGFRIYQNVDIYGYLAKKKEQGYIRQLGFSFHDTPEVLEQIVKTYPWDFTQLQLNYLDWEMQNAKRQYEILEQNGLPCIVMEPVRGGMLATLCNRSAEILHEAEPERSVASWAIRFAASLPNVMTVLSGMSNFEQVKDNIATVSPLKPLTEQDKQLLMRALDAFRESKTIPCTGCRYCMDCPAGVDIPLMFRLYNQFAIDLNKENFRRSYRETPESKWADKCVACGACMKHCPQSISIPDRMREIAEFSK